jgi:hypothetical protein
LDRQAASSSGGISQGRQDFCGHVNPGDASEGPPARYGIYLEDNSSSLAFIEHEIHPRHLSTHGSGRGTGQCFVVGIQLAKLSSSPLRHVGSPACCGGVSSHPAKKSAGEDERTKVMARVSNHFLQVKNSPDPLERVKGAPGEFSV